MKNRIDEKFKELKEKNLCFVCESPDHKSDLHKKGMRQHIRAAIASGEEEKEASMDYFGIDYEVLRACDSEEDF